LTNDELSVAAEFRNDPQIRQSPIRKFVNLREELSDGLSPDKRPTPSRFDSRPAMRQRALMI